MAHEEEQRVVLGAEHDAGLRKALLRVLKALGAEPANHSWAVVGSQEIERLVVYVDGEPLLVEVETYEGLTVAGHRSLVERIERLVQQEMAGARTAVVAPSNSLVLVMDKRAVMDSGLGDVPNDFRGSTSVAATAWCVGVGTLAASDGPTRISLVDEPPAPSAKTLVFEGAVETPNGTLDVCDVLGEIILSREVSAHRTRLQIWTNHPREPDAIDIVVCPD